MQRFSIASFRLMRGEYFIFLLLGSSVFWIYDFTGERMEIVKIGDRGE